MKILNNLHFYEFYRVIQLMKKRKWLYIISITISCAAYTAYQIFTSFINMNLINAVLNNNLRLLYNAFVFIFIALVISCVIDPIVTYFYQSCVKRTLVETRLELFHRIEKLPYNYLDSKHSGDIISTFTNDLNAIESAYGWQMYWFIVLLSDRLFVSNLDKMNCRENRKKKAGTYDLHKLKFRIA